MEEVAENVTQTDPAEPPAAVCKLPSFPPIATKVLQVLSQDNAEVGEIVRLVKADPAFGAEILQLSNSPLYPCSSRITSIAHAIVVIGLERTKALTMTVAMRSYLKRALKLSIMRQCWRHTLACALLGQELSPVFRIPVDRGYTGGLIHDIGRLGLLAAYPETYGPLLGATYETYSDVLASERMQFEVDHCQAGLWLGRAWGFPEELWEIAAHHHDATPLGNDDVSLVRVACRLASTMEYNSVKYERPTTFEDIVDALPEPIRQRFQFAPEELKERVSTKIDALNLM